jgi:hypothetical protein
MYEERLQGWTGRITPVPVPRRLLAPGSVTYPNVNIPLDTNPQNEPSVRISHKNPNRVVAAWRDFRTGVTPAVRRVAYSFSNDGGVTWGTPDLLPQIYAPGLTRYTDPAVSVDTAGNFYIATVALDDFNGNLKLIVFKSNPSLDYFDQAYFVPSDTMGSAYDKEYIECDLSSSSPYANNLYVAWSGTWFGPGTSFSRSTDEGVTWSPAITTNESGLYGFAPDLCVDRDGVVGISALHLFGSDSSYVTFERSTDGGVTFGTDAIVDTIVYSNDCPAAQLAAGYTTIAADITNGAFGGNIYLAYTDKHLGDQDIVVRVSSDGGATWSGRHRVNDDPAGNGKMQLWPWIAVDDRGVVTIVYYDNRNSVDCEITDTYAAYSWDGGLTFTNVLLTTAQSPKNQPNGNVRFGDYIGIDSWGGHTVPVWTDERAGGFDQDIYTAVLDTLPLVQFSGLRYDLRTGWNMVSVPVEPSNDSTTAVFPDALTGAQAWSGSYSPRDTVASGIGYWIKYSAQETVNLFGDSVVTDTVAISEGWNMIGPPINQVTVSSIVSDPPAIVTGPFYAYSGTYEKADVLLPGRAYWVKADQAGSLIMGPGASAAPVASRIVVRPSADGPPPPPSIDEPATGLPVAIALPVNYPNPFNPSTVISFALPEPALVTLKVFNVVGEAVATLADRSWFPPGSNRLKFDGSGLPSGVYICRVTASWSAPTAGNYTGSNKMLLVR